MAAERTWLAWWRTALAASAGALGCAYAGLSIGLLVVGALRQRDLERSHSPLRFRTVATFTSGGILLALATVLLVVAQI